MFEQEFVNQNIIVVTHGLGTDALEVKVIIDGIVRQDLINRLYTVAADHLNKLTVELSSNQTGRIQIFRENSLSVKLVDSDTLNMLNTLPQNSLLVGSQCQVAKSDSKESRTNTVWFQKLKMTTTNLPAGNYYIGWSFIIGTPDKKYIEIQVDLNDNDILMYHTQKLKSDEVQISGCDPDKPLSGGVHTIDVDFKSAQNGKEVWMKNTRLYLWRIS